MAAEHSRLDDLLARCACGAGQFDAATYEEFRRLLLRHISIEEKILLPAAQRRRNGTPLALAFRLRLDHGVLAALMMLPPVTSTFHAVRAVLDAHNPLEEAPSGAYEQCEDALGSELDELLARCVAAPAVPVSPWVDSPKVVAAAQRVLLRAGYDSSVLNVSCASQNHRVLPLDAPRRANPEIMVAEAKDAGTEQLVCDWRLLFGARGAAAARDGDPCDL